MATPIGNLRDFSLRAQEVLTTVDRVYAEDTRHTQRLLNSAGVKAKALVSLHEHNELSRVAEVVSWLESGRSAALVSDAGTPLISDPGYKLVERCQAMGIRVSPVPGPSAIIAALSVSGLPTDSFLYLGFAPSRGEMRRRWLKDLRKQRYTLVFYESRHRIEACLSDMREVLGGDREIALARELTKQFETVLRGSVDQVVSVLESDANQQKGEFVVIVKGASPEPEDDTVIRQLLSQLLADLSVKRSAEIAASLTGEKKNRLYKLALDISASKKDR